MTAEGDIRPVLGHWPGDCRSGDVQPLASAGGLSGARFWRIVAPRGVMCLRCWPGEHPGQQRLAAIHGVLRHVAARGFRLAPVPIETTSGATFVERAGRLWQLEPWLAGQAEPGEGNVPRSCAALAALAEFHAAAADASWTDCASAPTSGQIPAVERRIRGFAVMSAGGDELARAVQRVEDASWRMLLGEVLALAQELLPAAQRQLVLASRHAADAGLQPCIRDIWRDNVLFVGERVSGLVDFGAMDVDTVAGDVARLVGSLLGSDAGAWRQALVAYEQVRPLATGERALVYALDAANVVLSPVNWVHWLAIERRTFADPAAVWARLAHFRRRLAAPGLSEVGELGVSPPESVKY